MRGITLYIHRGKSGALAIFRSQHGRYNANLRKFMESSVLHEITAVILRLV